MHTTTTRMRGTILAIGDGHGRLWPWPNAATMQAIGGQNSAAGDRARHRRRRRRAAALRGCPTSIALSPRRRRGRPHASARSCGTTSPSSASSTSSRATPTPPSRRRGSPEQVPFASWRGARRRRGVLRHACSEPATPCACRCGCSTSRTRQSVFAKEYSGTASNPRLYAHTIADEVHQQQRAPRRRAHQADVSCLTATASRLLGPDRQPRGQGDLRLRLRRREPAAHHHHPPAEPHAVVVARRARAVAYTSHRNARTPQIFISLIYQGVLENADQGRRQQLPGRSSRPTEPDRGVHVEPRRQPGDLRCMNRDGSNVRRLTNHPAGDSYADLVAQRRQIAFTVRTGPGHARRSTS